MLFEILSLWISARANRPLQCFSFYWLRPTLTVRLWEDTKHEKSNHFSQFLSEAVQCTIAQDFIQIRFLAVKSLWAELIEIKYPWEGDLFTLSSVLDHFQMHRNELLDQKPNRSTEASWLHVLGLHPQTASISSWKKHLTNSHCWCYVTQLIPKPVFQLIVTDTRPDPCLFKIGAVSPVLRKHPCPPGENLCSIITPTVPYLRTLVCPSWL